MAMQFTAILPKPFFAPAFRIELEDSMERLAQGILLDFGRTVNTWNTKPEFDLDTNFNANFIEAHVYCDALKQGDRIRGTRRPNPAPPNLVYYFLNVGTDIRYAKMSLGFKAKTSVRFIGSTPGHGGVVKVDVRDPQPGIQARLWDEEIAKKYRRILPSQAEAALRRAARGSGHAF